MRSHRPEPWLLGALALLASCASAPRPAEQLSPEAVVLTVPIVSQDALYQCGLASISVLCQYHQVTLDEPRRTELAAIANERAGLSGSELREALESTGLEVFLFEGTLDREPTGVLRHVDAGRPLLVMTSPGGDVRHYVLFLGYDEPRGNVCLLDPLQGRVVVPNEVFDRSWERCQRFTLLAMPREAQPL